MWKGTWDFITATSKVVYDKTADYSSEYAQYLSWYQLEAQAEQEELNEDLDKLDNHNLDNQNTDNIVDEEKMDKIKESDTFDNYNQIIKVEKYSKESEASRILPEVGKWTEYSYFFSEPSHIIDNIYLGSAYNAASYDTLKKLNITTIINVTKEISNYYPDDFDYIKYNLYDNNEHSILEHLDDAYKKIKKHQQNKEGNILVHCYMGRSRSASVVLYYIMRNQVHDNGEPYTFDDALEYTKIKRPIINPTFRFTKDLAKSVMHINKNKS